MPTTSLQIFKTGIFIIALCSKYSDNVFGSQMHFIFVNKDLYLCITRLPGGVIGCGIYLCLLQHVANLTFAFRPCRRVPIKRV